MENIVKDIRYTFLMLRKRPGFTATVVLSLMLAICASTTVFSFFNAILLRAIPYENPNQLVVLFETFRKGGNERRGLSYPDYLDWRDQNQVFEQMAGFAPVSVTLSGEEPERIFGELVSASYFQALGVKAASGRTFTPDEDRTPDSHPVVVISHSLWQRRLGSDPNAVGKLLKLNDRDFTIIGVMPETFFGLVNESQLWMPMMMISMARSTRVLEQRTQRWHQAAARLKPGVTLQRAQSDLDILTSRIEQTYPDSNRNRGGLVVSLEEELFGPINRVLWLLMGAVGFVLLIACANMANLLLVRATNRQREFALRVALGAGRRRLIQQLLTESILLALIGGLLGLFLTYVSLNVLKASIPVNLPNFVDVSIDFKVFFFSFLISIITGIICGLVPALRASRPDLNDLLKEGGKGNAGGGRHLRNALVVAEVSLSLALVIGAGLTIGSLLQMQRIDLGFTRENIMTMRLSLPDTKYPYEKAVAFAAQLTQNIKSLPSVRSASIGSDSPMDEEYSALNISIEGERDTTQGADVRIYRHRVTPGFFSTAQVPLLKGRDFTDHDVIGQPPVAIISASLARRCWPSEEALGKRIKIRDPNSAAPWISIIGVAKDVKFRTVLEASNADPDVYFPLAQIPTRNLNLLVSASADPTSLIGVIRREITKIDPSLPAYGVMTLMERWEKQTSGTRFTVLLLSAFAIIALALAAIGVYGVMSYSMAQRTHEIGIRMALGAQTRDILWLALSQTIKLTAIGLAIGLIMTFALNKIISSVLYGIAATDPTTLIFASVILVATTLIASFAPAFRAVLVNPVTAFRQN
jgi:putative ABC transport system permease protein